MWDCLVILEACMAVFSGTRDTARPMIQDFQQSTEQWARRWEDQCIYCTTIALTYKKYCQVRLVLFAGVTHSNTHTPCCVGPAGRQPPVDQSLCRGMTRIPQPSDTCLVVWDATAVVAAILTLYAVECRGPHRRHARPSTAPAAARDVRPADADLQEILRLPDIRGQLAPESSRTRTDTNH